MLSVFLFLALGGVEAERGYSVMGVDHPGASAIRLMPMTAEERLERGMAAISPDLDEAADYPDGSAEGYAAISREFIDPIERAYGLMLRLSVAIANQFGAHG